MGKKVLVTGSSGFLGEKLVKELISQGHQVLGLDTLVPLYSDINFHFTKGSAGDLSVVLNLLSGVDEVYHLAARVPLAARESDFIESNVLSPGVVAKACRVKGVRSFLLVSSSAVYGLGRGFEFRESDQTKPFERYGSSKLAGEDSAIRELGPETKLVILRPRTILGPGRLGIFSTLFKWVKSDINIPVYGNDSYGLQFVGVDDMVDAMILSQAKGEGIYNVGSKNYNTTRRELDNLISYGKSNSKTIKMPSVLVTVLSWAYRVKLSPFTPWHVQGYANSLTVNTDKICSLGWEPKESTESIILNNYSWFIGNKNFGGSPHQKKIDSIFLKLISVLLK